MKKMLLSLLSNVWIEEREREEYWGAKAMDVLSLICRCSVHRYTFHTNTFRPPDLKAVDFYLCGTLCALKITDEVKI